MKDSESKVKHGLLWLGTAGAALRAIDLLSSVVILWLLTREQMGLASLSWTVAVIIESFNGLGVGTAMVQAEKVDDDDLHSLFWFTVAFGALFVIGIVVASPWIARSFATPELAPMVGVAALRLLFMATGLVPLQLLQRRLEFRAIAAVQTFAAALAAITKVTLAMFGFGAWALVLGHTSEGLFTLLTLYAFSPFWPKLRCSFQRLKPFVRFGLKAATSTILYQTYRNLDFVIVGRAFGVSTLGAYRVAFDVAMIPLMAILDVINRTAFPIYARIGLGERERLKALFLRMTRNLALIAGAIAVVLYFYGADILVAVSGEKWQPAGPMIQALCWAAFLRTLAQAVPQLFHAAGRPELAVYDSLLTLPCFLACGWAFVALFGSSFGANAVSVAWIVTYLVTLTALRWMARSVIGLTAWEYLKNLAHPLLLMALMFSLLLATRATLFLYLPRSLAVALGVSLGAAIMVGYLRFVLGFKFSDLLSRKTRVSGSE